MIDLNLVNNHLVRWRALAVGDQRTPDLDNQPQQSGLGQRGTPSSKKLAAACWEFPFQTGQSSILDLGLSGLVVAAAY